VIHPHFPSNRTGWGCYVIAPQSLGGVRRLIVALIAERLDTGHVTNMPRSGSHPSSGRMGLAHVNECHVIVSLPRQSVGSRFMSSHVVGSVEPSGERVRRGASGPGRASRAARSPRVPAWRGRPYEHELSENGLRPAGYVGRRRASAGTARGGSSGTVSALAPRVVPSTVFGASHICCVALPCVARSFMARSVSISARVMSSGNAATACRVVGHLQHRISRRHRCGAAPRRRPCSADRP
jgi:hypothetical protein